MVVGDIYVFLAPLALSQLRHALALSVARSVPALSSICYSRKLRVKHTGKESIVRLQYDLCDREHALREHVEEGRDAMPPLATTA